MASWPVMLASFYREGILHFLLCDVAAVVSVKVPEGIVHGVLLLQVAQVHRGRQELLIVNAACAIATPQNGCVVSSRLQHVDSQTT